MCVSQSIPLKNVLFLQVSRNVCCSERPAQGPEGGKTSSDIIRHQTIQKGSRKNAATLRESFRVGSPLNQLGCNLLLLSGLEESQQQGSFWFSS